MERVFLDTDIFSEILKGRDESVVAAARTYLEARGRFSITVITVMEIVSGLMRKRASVQLSKFEAMLTGCEIVPFDEEAASLAGTIDAAERMNVWGMPGLAACAPPSLPSVRQISRIRRARGMLKPPSLRNARTTTPS
jgi:hypothetical protein